MAQNITFMGASYSDVPAVTLPKTGGGTAKFTDVTPTTATDSDVLSGKVYFKADGTQSTGTGSGGGSATIESLTVTPSTSQQTFNSAGVDGYKPVVVNAMPSGSAQTPATSITANPSISVSTGGLITATVSSSKSVTPTVSAGYVSSGTAGTVSVSGSNTSQLTVQAGATFYPSTSDQTISSGKYLTGTQTIKALTYANITADNIKNGVTVTIGDSADADRVLSVTGTYTGGGGSSKNVQMCLGRWETNASSYTATSATITVSKAGTYKCSWTQDRNTTSGTNGSRLYKNGTAMGTAHTSWTHNGSFCQETLTLALNDVLVIRARARNTSYYVGVGNFIIEEQ